MHNKEERGVRQRVADAAADIAKNYCKAAAGVRLRDEATVQADLNISLIELDQHPPKNRLPK